MINLSQRGKQIKYYKNEINYAQIRYRGASLGNLKRM